MLFKSLKKLSNKDTSFSKKSRVFNCNGKVLDFESPKVMGILNLSPESFYDGGFFDSKDKWISRTQKMLDEGADIIDIGAASSRPGAKLISLEDEIERLLPALKILRDNFPSTIFSVDTFRSEVAKQSFDHGANIINDISGGNLDDKMFETIAKLDIPYILMHMQGIPDSMQDNPIDNGIIKNVKTFFTDKLRILNELGVKDVILDPGFGFGKTLNSNYHLLKFQEDIRISDLPILSGLSRKSMINKVLNTTPEEALNGTSILNLIAVQNGANILRVHDVKEAKQLIQLWDYYETINPSS